MKFIKIAIFVVFFCLCGWHMAAGVELFTRSFEELNRIVDDWDGEKYSDEIQEIYDELLEWPLPEQEKALALRKKIQGKCEKLLARMLVMPESKKDAEWYHSVVYLERILGDLQASMRYCREGLKVFPENVKLMARITELHNMAEDWGAAIEWITKLLETTKDVKYHGERGMYYARIGDNDRALEDLNRYLDTKPQDDFAGLCYFFRALVLCLRGEYEKALDDFAVIEQSVPILQVYQGSAFALQKLGRYEEALADVDQAIALIPKAPVSSSTPDIESELKGMRGDILLQLGRTKEGIAVLEALLEKTPNEEYHTLCAKAYQSLGKSDKAEHHTRKARELQAPPEYWKSLRNPK